MKLHSIHTTLISVIFITLLSVSSTFAETHAHDHHEHDFLEFDSHVHGEATAHITLIDSSLTIELQLPAFNVFGFEHGPENKEEQQVITNRLNYLRESKALIELPPTCNIQKTDVISDLEKHHNNAHQAVPAGRHSDITATYIYLCERDNEEVQLNFIFFNKLSSLNKILVQFVSDHAQETFTVTPARSTISLH